MAAAIQWIDGEAHIPGVVERICPRTHIRPNQWSDESNAEAFHGPQYSYISDYDCIFNYPVVAADNIDMYSQVRWQNLQAAKQQGMNVSITNLAHFTDSAQAIIVEGGLRGTAKKINQDLQRNAIMARLSWWSPIFTAYEITQVRDTLQAAIQPFVGEGDDLNVLTSQFAISDAFSPFGQAERYGSFYFKYGINELCQHYQNYTCNAELQYKILGTYVYKQEIMHAVLVCGPTYGVSEFAAYPSVLTPAQDVNNQAVVTRDINQNWAWNPKATGTKIMRLDAHWQKFPMYRRWEHVAFAFHVPDEFGDLFIIPKSQEHCRRISHD